MLYDEFPYESNPFSYTRPEHLRTVGMFFGMTPPEIENARILELGCASGGNIIGFAESYPKSYTLGIDLSKIEIDCGNQIIQSLGLKNIDLKHLSITELDDSFGKFDYIICHGVFSWVPDIVRNKILEISNKLLNKNGIAFVSYNTLPGWNIVNSVREMMRFHSTIFIENTDKVTQARLFLDFVRDSLKNSDSPYSKFLTAESSFLANFNDCYLFHEYLGEENTQFYFYQFIDMAKKHSLAYLGDTDIQTMYLGNLPKIAVEKLVTVNDIIRTEQYMDFIYNRRFRCTMLCHQGTSISRHVDSILLNKFYTSCNLIPQKLEKDIDLSNALESISFIVEKSAAPISTASPILKAIFYTYVDNIGNPLKSDELINLAQNKLPTFSLKDFETEFNNILGKLVLSGIVQLFASKPGSIFNISLKPKVSDLVRYQIKSTKIDKLRVTNQINNLVSLLPHEKYVIELLDGNSDITVINQRIYEKLLNGELLAGNNGQRITDSLALSTLAEECVSLSLEKFRRNFLLIG